MLPPLVDDAGGSFKLQGEWQSEIVESRLDKIFGLLCTAMAIRFLEVHKCPARTGSGSGEQDWHSFRSTEPIMANTANVPSANQNPCTTIDTTTDTTTEFQTSTDSNVMYHGRGESRVEPTTTFESTVDDLSVGWNGQMTEPQQQYQQQYHISQHQNHRAQTQPSHHGNAVQDLGYPDYPLANISTFQPPVSMTGALDVQPSDHHVTDGYLFQASYHNPTTSVVDNEDSYVARLPGYGWTPSTEAQRMDRKQPGVDSIAG